MLNSPFFKISLFIITLYFLFSGLYYVQELLIPILFAGLIAMLVLPLCRFLERKKLSRSLSIVICLLIIFIVISGIVLLTYSQLAVLAEDFPLFKEKSIEKFASIQVFIEKQTKISSQEQMQWIEGNYSKLLNSGGTMLKTLLVGVTGGFATFLLIIIYIFFFLLLRDRLKGFILQFFKEEQHKNLRGVIGKIQGLTVHYMTGLLIEIVALGTLNSIGFLILGIKQAIFFGFLGAILNLIPYLGAIIGAIFPMFVALIYKDSIWYPLGVLVVIIITQFIDNNFLTPKIVGAHIRINALATIVVILVGGAVWGLAGMILFLPLLGIFKIICDHVEPLKPFGYLIGEDPEEVKAGLNK
jgi:AI-2 transport protein TqsA